jgi:hypothetical protein
VLSKSLCGKFGLLVMFHRSYISPQCPHRGPDALGTEASALWASLSCWMTFHEAAWTFHLMAPFDLQSKLSLLNALQSPSLLLFLSPAYILSVSWGLVGSGGHCLYIFVLCSLINLCDNPGVIFLLCGVTSDFSTCEKSQFGWNKVYIFHSPGFLCLTIKIMF